MNDYKAPRGYALISEEALREWGKLEEVREMCVYPVRRLHKPPSHVDNAPFGFSPNEASAWSTGHEHGYENACEDFYRKGISNAS